MASILTLSENELWLSLPRELSLNDIHYIVKEECQSLKHSVTGKDLIIKGRGTVTMLNIIANELNDSYKSCVIDVETQLAAY